MFFTKAHPRDGGWSVIVRAVPSMTVKCGFLIAVHAASRSNPYLAFALAVLLLALSARVDWSKREPPPPATQGAG